MPLFHHPSRQTSPALAGVLQAAGIVLYIALFAAFVNGIGRVEAFLPPPLMMGLVLLLFSFSALVCGLITLAYPAWLVMRQRWRDAVMTLGWMAGVLAVCIGLYLLLLLA